MKHIHGNWKLLGLQTKAEEGFTLIELSVVLVIIGLIIGGILIGQEMLTQAATRAQITQIDKYNTAVNTFYGKYGGIPGDLLNTSATQFGFVMTGCSGTRGFRDGNGLLDGGGSAASQYDQTVGEVFAFWADISQSNLTDIQLPANGAAPISCSYLNTALSLTPGTTYVGDYYPVGKIGYGTFVYVYETNGFNWFGLSTITSVPGSGAAVIDSSPLLPVILAYNIDKKIDDGLATTGNVVAVYLNNSQSSTSKAPNTTTAGGNATSCYDTTTNGYSTSQSGGIGPNCALSFKMIGAAR